MSPDPKLPRRADVCAQEGTPGRLQEKRHAEAAHAFDEGHPARTRSADGLTLTLAISAPEGGNGKATRLPECYRVLSKTLNLSKKCGVPNAGFSEYLFQLNAVGYPRP